MPPNYSNLHGDPFVNTLANETLAAFETVAARQTDFKSGLSTTQRKLLELFESINLERRFNELDLSHAVPLRRSLHEACVAVTADPAKALWLRTVAKKLARAPQSSFSEEEAKFSRALTTGDSGFGQALSLAEPVAADVYNLMVRYGAFRTLGVVPLATGLTKLATVTRPASAVWYTPTNQGTTIPTDANIAGLSISPQCATLAALVEVSGEELGDGKTTFETALLQAIVEGLNFGMDWACFAADGTDDTTDGGQTGIFSHPDVSVANAAAGHDTIGGLDRDDFIRVVAAVTPSALQRSPRWWIAPQLLPKLMMLKDGPNYVLTPPTIWGGDWLLLGWPITWTAAAPSTDAAGAKVAAFGRGDAYAVALRQDFEIASSAGAKFDQNLWLFRAIARARCIMRDATSLAVLKLAA